MFLVFDFNKMGMHWTTVSPCGHPVLVQRYQLVYTVLYHACFCTMFRRK